MQKLRIKRQSNCIRSGTINLGHIQLSKNLQFEAFTNQRLETGAFNVVRENSGYCVQCTFPLYLPFSKKLSKIRGTMPLAGHHSINQI